MPIKRSYLDIKSDGRTRITNATPITEFGETSITGAFLDIIATESEQIYSEIEYVHRAIDPTRNYGKELDNLGYMMGIIRNNGYVAIDESTTNVHFYIDKRTNMTPGMLINNLYKIYQYGYTYTLNGNKLTITNLRSVDNNTSETVQLSVGINLSLSCFE